MLDAHIVKVRAHFTVDIALRVPSGEACGLFGISGAGKSSVLACIAGAEDPDGGRVTLDGVTLFPPPLALHRRPIGYLTQEANLFPHLSVAENVRFGLSSGVRGERESWLEELRDRLQLGPIWRKSVTHISGGQARRVALARMLTRMPSLVLLDEPFSGLDRNLVRDLLVAVEQWRQQLGFSLLVVDHDAEILSRLCRRVVVVEQGRAVQDASWDVLRARPATASLLELLAPL